MISTKWLQLKTRGSARQSLRLERTRLIGPFGKDSGASIRFRIPHPIVSTVSRQILWRMESHCTRDATSAKPYKFQNLRGVDAPPAFQGKASANGKPYLRSFHTWLRR